MYLLDTNIIIYFLNGHLPPGAVQSFNNIIDVQSNVSVITKMKTLGYNFKTAIARNSMEAFIDNSNVLEINDTVVDKTIAIRKSRKIELPDAIIAATALANNLILLTANIQDFKNIQGLQVVDPRNL